MQWRNLCMFIYQKKKWMCNLGEKINFKNDSLNCVCLKWASIYVCGAIVLWN